MRVPAVVGSWPEPFAAGLDGPSERPGERRLPRGRPRLRRAASASLADGRGRRTGRVGRPARIGDAALACWSAPGRSCVRRTRRSTSSPARPATSGVFARFRAHRTGGWHLHRRSIRPGPRPGRWGLGPAWSRRCATATGPPTWVVTGTDAAGVDAGASAPRPDDPAHRYAVAADGRRHVALPGRPRRRADEVAARLLPAARPARGRRARSRRPPTSGRSPSSRSSTRTRSSSPAPARRSCVAGLLRRRRRGALRAAARWGLSARASSSWSSTALVSQRGDTISSAGCELPVLGHIDVSAEALAEGAVLALRITRRPDGLRGPLGLRRPRPGAAPAAPARPPLGADRDADHPAGAARGRRPRPAAARPRAARPGARRRSGRAALARRLVAGSLDRAVDIAATLELRGYARGAPRRRGGAAGSRHGWPLRRGRRRDRRDRDRRARSPAWAPSTPTRP